MTPRDPDALIRTWLSEGAEDRSVQLPDRVVDAIVADIHLTRRRAGSGPWRFFDMSRNAIVSVAAVIAVIVAGAALLALLRPAASVGAPSPAPSLAAVATASHAAPSVAPSSAPSATPSAAALAIGSPFPDQNVIEAGSAYHSVDFPTPLAFTMPAYASAPSGLFNAQTWLDRHGLKIYWNGDHAVTISDGIPVENDICSPSGVIDTPGTPTAIGAWLHGAKSNAEVVDLPQVALSDGTRADVFDVVLGPHCHAGSQPPPGEPPFWFSTGEKHRVYAVPAGDRTILVVTFAPVEDAKAMGSTTNALVASLKFQ
jgi:hypothetical protein